MRHAHYWKLAGAKCAPAEMVVFDCETWHDWAAREPSGEWHTLRLGCALAYRLERGKRTRVKRLTFYEPRPFWELVESRLNKRRPVWVFAHNASYDLGVVGTWRFLLSPEVEVEKAAISGQILYIKCVYRGCGIVFCDTLNYWKSSLKSVGKAVGVEKLDMPTQYHQDYVWEAYCKNDVDVTAAAIDALIAFTRKERLGPWQPSIASLSFSGYRSRFMREKVLVHDTVPILKLEREAYYGGLVETPVVGKRIEGPVYELDVCSMYPAVCRNPLPYYMKDWSDKIGVDGLKRLANKYMLCADVLIESQSDPYPVRLKDGTYHPTGKYRTSLAHPELMDAIGKGYVKWVYRAAWYRHAPIFREYMEHFIGMKSKYRKQPGGEAFATLCKYYGNSLYGKTGQLTPKWVEWNSAAMKDIEVMHGLPEGYLDGYRKPPDQYRMEDHARLPGCDEPFDVRNYYGVVEIRIGEAESRDSCPIIAATVTSYARCLLRSYIRTAGVANVYYCDTDSVWTNEEGKRNLETSGVVADDRLGFLSVKDTHEFLTVYGAKDYETNLVRRLKGIRPTAESDGQGGWTQLHFPSAAAQVSLSRTGGVFVDRVTKHCHRKLTKCVRLPDGRTRPLVFPAENPELAKRPKVRRVRGKLS